MESSAAKIGVYGATMLSRAGCDLESHWQKLQSGESLVDKVRGKLVLPLTEDLSKQIEGLRTEPDLRRLDPAVLLGVQAARGLSVKTKRPERTGVVWASSRGATHNLERSHEQFLSTSKSSAYSSPTTTAGQFASAVARDQKTSGLNISVSAACVSSLYGAGVGVGFLRAGILDEVIVGASEMALTPFTLAQLEATGIYAKETGADPVFPYAPMRKGSGGMVLGDGAGAVHLALGTSRPEETPLCWLRGFGAASEGAEVNSLTGITKNAHALVQAGRAALLQAELQANDIDLVVVHGAGTRKGDQAELAAYEKLFAGELPMLATHKWLTGHTLGAAGVLAIGWGIMHILKQDAGATPYATIFAKGRERKEIRNVMVCGLGFGGNGAALILGRS